MSTDSSFSITPDAPFSLAAAASFGFGHRAWRPRPVASEMRLAFVTDDMAHQAGVYLTQGPDGVVRGAVETDGDPEAAWRQALRVLSLDHSGAAWAEVGTRDPVIGQLQDEHAGLRPVLHYSPYEAAAWCIISARRYLSTAAVIRERICDDLGSSFSLNGERLSAFPSPARLLAAVLPSISPRRMPWLHAVARAALDGALDPARLAAMDPVAAITRLCQLPGIGPAYATLILVRATGGTDILTLTEPRLPEYVSHFYGLGPEPATIEQLAEVAQGWQPFRTWAAVLVRVAGDRQGLPLAA
jgi:DNA-3-methyladenine glycosylase II